MAVLGEKPMAIDNATRRLLSVRRSRAKLTPQSRGSVVTTIRAAKRPGAARELFRSTQIFEGLLSPRRRRPKMRPWPRRE